MLSNIYFTIYVYVYIALLVVFFWQLTKFQGYFSVLRPTLQTLRTEIIPQYGDTLGKTKKLSEDMEKKRVGLYSRFYTNYKRLCLGTQIPTVIAGLMAAWSIIPMAIDQASNTFYLDINISVAMIGVSVGVVIMSARLLASWEDFAYKYKREFDSYSAVVYNS